MFRLEPCSHNSQQSSYHFFNSNLMCRYIIQFESIPKKKNVFRYGDYGDKFYIILKGKVSVHVPIKVQSQNRDDDSIYSYLMV